VSARVFEKAVAADKKGDLYADPCEETGDFGVFGTESGFCYTTRSTQKDAEMAARELRASLGIGACAKT